MLYPCHTAQRAFNINFWRNLGERRRVYWSLGLLNDFSSTNATLKSTCWIVNNCSPNIEICRLLWKPNTHYRLNEIQSFFPAGQQDTVREQDTPDSYSWSPEPSFTVDCLSAVGNDVFCTIGYVTRIELYAAGQNTFWSNLSNRGIILNAWGKSRKVFIRLVGFRLRFESVTVWSRERTWYQYIWIISFEVTRV